MDWVIPTLVLGTGAFLFVILRDFQANRLRRYQRILQIKDQTEKLEARLVETREQEAKVKLEFESAQRDLSEAEKARTSLQKTLASRAQQRR